MIVKKSAIALACFFAATSLAYADNSTSSSTTPTTTATTTHKHHHSQKATSTSVDHTQMQMAVQLTQLQHTLNQLNKEVAQKKQQQVAAAASNTTSNSGMLNSLYQKTRNFVKTDGSNNNYFELMPVTTYDLAVLQDKDNFPVGTIGMGGYLESDLQTWDQDGIVTNTPNASKSSQFSLTTAIVDATANVNQWVQVFTSLKMGTVATTRGGNSPQVFFNKAFVTVGNLDKTPFYITAGKTYIPFGVYTASGPWSVALTRAYFRANETPQVIFGFFNSGLTSNLSVFQDSAKNEISNFVYNLNYAHTINTLWNFDVGAGYMNDIVGAANTAFGGANGGTITSNGINPAVDLNAALNYAIYGVSAEYDQTLRDTITNYGNVGQTKAWDVGVTAAPVVMSQPTTFALVYSGAAGIKGIPVGLANDVVNGPVAINGMKQAWIAYVSRPIISNNVQVGVEYQRATTYFDKIANVGTVDLSVFF